MANIKEFAKQVAEDFRERQKDTLLAIRRIIFRMPRRSITEPMHSMTYDKHQTAQKRTELLKRMTALAERLLKATKGPERHAIVEQMLAMAKQSRRDDTPSK